MIKTRSGSRSSATNAITTDLQLDATLTSEARNDTSDVNNDQDDQISRKTRKIYILIGIIIGSSVVSALLLIVVMSTCISSRAKQNAKVSAHANDREVYRNELDSRNLNNSSSIPMERNLSHSLSSPQTDGKVIHYYSSNSVQATAEKVQDDNSSCSMQNEDNEYDLAMPKFSSGHGIRMHANIAYKPILGESQRGEIDPEMEESEGYSYVLRGGESDSCEANENDTTEISMSYNIAYGQSIFSKV